MIGNLVKVVHVHFCVHQVTTEIAAPYLGGNRTEIAVCACVSANLILEKFR
jgi:hypothetical protein